MFDKYVVFDWLISSPKNEHSASPNLELFCSRLYQKLARLDQTWKTILASPEKILFQIEYQTILPQKYSDEYQVSWNWDASISASINLTGIPRRISSFCLLQGMDELTIYDRRDLKEVEKRLDKPCYPSIWLKEMEQTPYIDLAFQIILHHIIYGLLCLPYTWLCLFACLYLSNFLVTTTLCVCVCTFNNTWMNVHHRTCM